MLVDKVGNAIYSMGNLSGINYFGSSVSNLYHREYKQGAKNFAEGVLRVALTAASIGALVIVVSALDRKASLREEVQFLSTPQQRFISGIYELCGYLADKTTPVPDYPNVSRYSPYSTYNQDLRDYQERSSTNLRQKQECFETIFSLPADMFNKLAKSDLPQKIAQYCSHISSIKNEKECLADLMYGKNIKVLTNLIG